MRYTPPVCLVNSDAPMSVRVFDSCDNDAEIWRAEGLGFPDDGPDFERLDRASLDVSLVTLTDGLGSSVDAEIHLLEANYVWRESDQLIHHKRRPRFPSSLPVEDIERGDPDSWHNAAQLTTIGFQAMVARVARASAANSSGSPGDSSACALANTYVTFVTGRPVAFRRPWT